MDVRDIIVAAATSLAGLSIGYVILSNHIHEGLPIKLGLVAMVFGFLGVAAMSLGLAYSPDGPTNAVVCIAVGVVLVFAGYAWRALRAQQPLRRKDDWLATHQHGRRDSDQGDRVGEGT